MHNKELKSAIIKIAIRKRHWKFTIKMKVYGKEIGIHNEKSKHTIIIIKIHIGKLKCSKGNEGSQ